MLAFAALASAMLASPVTAVKAGTLIDGTGAGPEVAVPAGVQVIDLSDRRGGALKPAQRVPVTENV